MYMCAKTEEVSVRIRDGIDLLVLCRDLQLLKSTIKCGNQLTLAHFSCTQFTGNLSVHIGLSPLLLSSGKDSQSIRTLKSLYTCTLVGTCKMANV